MREIQSEHQDGLWTSKSYMGRKKKVVMMWGPWFAEDVCDACICSLFVIRKKGFCE